ncbi:MAG: hypothetical protein M1832_000606 [Thelocarpon impressellum]|nr:MAG: hypothetical protein M1832_000606 [Thelocarpon impressellum]
MPPRGFTNPAPKTESAREARKEQRLKDLKQMQRDPLATSKARRAERRADEKSGLITIKPLAGPSAPATSSTATSSTSKAAAVGGGFRKGGFRNAFGAAGDRADEGGEVMAVPAPAPVRDAGAARDAARDECYDDESETDEEAYDPRYPTD